MHKSTIGDALEVWQKKNLGLYCFGGLVGLFSGIIVVSYRLALNYAGKIRHDYFDSLRSNLTLENIALTALGIVILSLTLGVIITYFPMTKGSGIPQVKGVLIRQLRFRWFRELVVKFFGGVLAIGAGLSLGREGPSVQLGAEVGKGVFRVFKRKDLERKYLVSCGASAGLAAAFNAPLSGVIFAIEELHKFMSPVLITCVMISSVVADFVSKYFFGLKPTFQFHVNSAYDLHDYFLIIVFALIVTFAGKMFSNGIIKFQDIYSNIKLPAVIRPIIIIIIAFLAGTFFYDITGGGHHLAEEIIAKNFTYKKLWLLLIGKFLFTLICYSSGIPGGIFLPILVLGAILGKIYGMFLVDFMGYQEGYVIYFVILGMASYLTAVVRAPITGTVLILEMTGSFSHFFPLITVSMATFLISEIIGMKPIYDTLLANMLKNNEEKKLGEEEEEKVTIVIPVGPDSHFEEKKVSEVSWPEKCLIVGIQRGEEEIIPKGSTKMIGGDMLIILTDKITAKKVKPTLIKRGEEVLI